MPATQFTGGTTSNGLTNRHIERNPLRSMRLQLPSQSQEVDQKRLLYSSNVGWYSPINRGKLSTTRCRKPHLPVVRNQMRPDCGLGSPDLDECLASLTTENDVILKQDPSHYDASGGLHGLKDTTPSQSHPPDVKKELLMLSWPALVGQAIDPLAQLMETAYIGRLGAVELGSAGVSMSIFNIISKLFNIPLLSVATSFVAEDFSKSVRKDSGSGEGSGVNFNGKPTFQRKQLSSVSTALLLAGGIGIFEGVALYFGSGQFLSLMGLPSGSPMRTLAQRFLSLRALGAPAVVLSLALQGIFRGFKDTKTPVLCLGIGNLLAAFLFPILMYSCGLGITGAAISTVLSQYAVAFCMLWCLNKQVILMPPKMGSLQFGGYIKSGGYLLGRTLAVLTTMTVGTSMAARQGPMAMAAHQICMQVWLAVSLLTDALAASAQALIAGSLSKKDYKTVKEVTNFVLKIGLFTGIALAVILGCSFSSLATLFTQDAELLAIVKTGVLFVSASQPLNALAYIFDGLHYGVSDFPYAANSMMIVSAISSAFLLYLPSIIGLRGVWLGLTLLMGLRTAAGYLRLSSRKGPWWFLHQDLHEYELARSVGEIRK